MTMANHTKKLLLTGWSNTANPGTMLTPAGAGQRGMAVLLQSRPPSDRINHAQRMGEFQRRSFLADGLRSDLWDV